MNRSAILPEMMKELKDMEELKDRFIASVLHDDIPEAQKREYKGAVRRCEKKINGLRFKISKMNEFIAHQEHQSNSKGTK